EIKNTFEWSAVPSIDGSALGFPGASDLTRDSLNVMHTGFEATNNLEPLLYYIWSENNIEALTQIFKAEKTPVLDRNSKNAELSVPEEKEAQFSINYSADEKEIVLGQKFYSKFTLVSLNERWGSFIDSKFSLSGIWSRIFSNPINILGLNALFAAIYVIILKVVRVSRSRSRADKVFKKEESGPDPEPDDVESISKKIYNIMGDKLNKMGLNIKDVMPKDNSAIKMWLSAFQNKGIDMKGIESSVDEVTEELKKYKELFKENNIKASVEKLLKKAKEESISEANIISLAEGKDNILKGKEAELSKKENEYREYKEGNSSEEFFMLLDIIKFKFLIQELSGNRESILDEKIKNKLMKLGKKTRLKIPEYLFVKKSSRVFDKYVKELIVAPEILPYLIDQMLDEKEPLSLTTLIASLEAGLKNEKDNSVKSLMEEKLRYFTKTKKGVVALKTIIKDKDNYKNLNLDGEAYKEAIDYILESYSEKTGNRVWRDAIAREELEKIKKAEQDLTGFKGLKYTGMVLGAFLIVAGVVLALNIATPLIIPAAGLIMTMFKGTAAWVMGLPSLFKVAITFIGLPLALMAVISKVFALVQSSGSMFSKAGLGKALHNFAMYKPVRYGGPWWLRMSLDFIFKSVVGASGVILIGAAAGISLSALFSVTGIITILAISFIFGYIFNQRTINIDIEEGPTKNSVRHLLYTFVIEKEIHSLALNPYLTEYLVYRLEKKKEKLADVMKEVHFFKADANKRSNRENWSEVLDFLLFAIKTVTQGTAKKQSINLDKFLKDKEFNGVIEIWGYAKKEYAKLDVSKLSDKAKESLRRILSDRKYLLHSFAQERFNSFFYNQKENNWEDLDKGFNHARNKFFESLFPEVAKKPSFRYNLWSLYSASLAIILGSITTVGFYLTSTATISLAGIPAIFKPFMLMAAGAPSLWLVSLGITAGIILISMAPKFTQVYRTYRASKNNLLVSAVVSLFTTPFRFLKDLAGYWSLGIDPRSDSIWRGKTWMIFSLLGFVACNILIITAVAPYFINLITINAAIKGSLFIFSTVMTLVLASVVPLIMKSFAASVKHSRYVWLFRLLPVVGAAGLYFLSGVITSSPVAMIVLAAIFIVNNILFTSYSVMELIEAFI
ncbi:MAG: hypothetical protein KKH08_06705, partial [Candidatus Omnitrophica bacterium]|nr:hypothetical protein [Candidatus Omnitrophota bacterium]